MQDKSIAYEGGGDVFTTSFTQRKLRKVVRPQLEGRGVAQQVLSKTLQQALLSRKSLSKTTVVVSTGSSN